MQAVRNTNVIKPGMYRIASSTTQTRTPQLNQTFRNTNPRASTSTGVAHKTNVSRPQPRSNQMKDKVVPYTSHAKLKKTEVEEHPRISSISNKTKTSNANAVCATCGKCVFNSNHDACVSKFLNDVNARTKKPNVVPISTRKPKSQANKSVATPHKKTVASESTITSSKSYYRMLYKKTSKAWKWWIAQQCPSTFKWVPKTQKKWVPKTQKKWIVQLILFIVDSGCTKHMTGNVSLLCNFVEKYLGTVRFGNDQYAPILVYEIWFRKHQRSKEFTTSKVSITIFSRLVNYCDADLENVLVERRNRTLVEAARTMLSASKLPLFFWAEAIATVCYTQNRSIIIPTHQKTAYHIINDRKPSIKHLHIFGCTCYLTRDGENLDKMKEKGDTCILVGYSTKSKGYRVYNKRTRLIVESIHLRFDEIKEMNETSVANDTSGLVPQQQKASDYDNSDPAPELQNVSPTADTAVPSQQELDLLFGPLYDEFFNDGTSRVNKSSSPTDNSVPQDTHPSTNIQPTSEPSTPTNAHAEENNVDQAEFTNAPPLILSVHRYKKLLSLPHAIVILAKALLEGIQFLGDKLVSWMSKKQDCTAMSSAEAEYVALSASCAQVMWMRTQLQDYGFNYNKIPLYCDSQSAIAISCNPVQHSRTKHIHTRLNMFTKALPEERFQYLVRRIGMRCLTPAELEVLTKESA
ncbi:retrovirus-related pol polyprotein from transposon TNT 1-94 [Tanacetum coccineum]